MTYRVELTETAKADIRLYVRHGARDELEP
jgi:hypothetical protein